MHRCQIIKQDKAYMNIMEVFKINKPHEFLKLACEAESHCQQRNT